MVLPWKKHRISQLVADLQSPAKRRGSMVVETGFTASLVDLFVKNRDRLRSKKHAHRRRGIDIASTDSPRIEVPVTIPPPTEAIDGGDGIESIRCRVDGDGSFAIRASAAVVKAFVVVAMALSTKKLVFGITLSAFALLLLEYVGNYIDIDVGLCLKPCERVLDLIQRGPPLLRLKSDLVCESVGEIESVGNSNFEEDIGVREEAAVEREQSCVDMRMAVEGNEDRVEEGLLYVKNRSRSRRIKSKIIKKCVQLRDLRRKKNKSTGTGSEEDEWIDGSEKSGYLSVEDCEEDKRIYDEPQILCEMPREKSGRGRREGNSGCEMLILIALIGLVGGRVWGFVFTVVWCLALKSLGNQGQVQNVPVIRSLVSIRR